MGQCRIKYNKSFDLMPKTAPFTLMAEEHPPSPNHEDESFLLGRLRVKPAMTVRGAVFGIRLKDLV